MNEDFDPYTLLTGFSLDRVVVFDTETTGLHPYGGDEVLAIAICDGMGTPLFSSYVRPTRMRSWPEAERVNGISPAMVRYAPTLKEITPQIREHLLGNKLVVGYNVLFDISFLLKGGALETWPMATFDVMSEYASIHGTARTRHHDGYRYSKLSTCAASYGYDFQAHDAMGDARATAHCFRALLCDEAYIRPQMKEKLGHLKNFRVSQTKATTTTVLELVEGGVTSSVRAELRLGEITRGKNKGAPRYECFIEDRCVGVSGSASTDQIRTLYALEKGSPLPTKIPCKALLSASGERASCEVTITSRGKLMDKMLEAAADKRSQQGMEYRNPSSALPKRVSRKSDDSPSPISAESADKSLKETGRGGCLGCFILSIFILLAFGQIVV